MLKEFFLSALATMIVSSPLPNLEDIDAKILTYEYKVLDDGYSFEYTTSNGITRKETGHLKIVTNADTREPDEIMDVEGFYSYTGDDGKLYQVNYHADENGYVPNVSNAGAAKPVLIGGRRPNRPAKIHQQNKYTFPNKNKYLPLSRYNKKAF